MPNIFGVMSVVQALTNSFGESVIAANVIVVRVDSFATMPAISFGTAMTTYAGQNMGAGLEKRVKKGAVQGSALAAGISAIITVLLVIFGRYLMGIFTNTQNLVEMSYHFMCILAGGYIIFSVIQVLCGLMRGAGNPMAIMWVSVTATFLVRLPLAYFMVWFTKSELQPIGRPECLYISQLAAWLFGLGLTLVFYKRVEYGKTHCRNK